MNKNYTLKELADIGAKAAEDECSTMAVSRGHEDFGIDTPAREAFTKAVLDAIGYEFPKDEEREAFDAWQTSVGWDLRDSTFEAWKAGREELRRANPVCAANPDAKPKEPAWIPWTGGECPLPDGVKRWEVMFAGGHKVLTELPPSKYYWIKDSDMADIVAYRVWE